jgi:hypothetical protein
MNRDKLVVTKAMKKNVRKLINRIDQAKNLPPTKSRILPSLILSKTKGSAIETECAIALSDPELDSELEAPKLTSWVIKEPSKIRAPRS